MDDLLGEDWQKPAQPKPATTTTAPVSASTFASNYSSLRASPALPQSGTTSPVNLSRPSSTVNGSTKAPANDSFGNLLSLKSQKAGAALSMQERQKQLLEEKKRQQDQQSQLWASLGSGRGTPEVRGPSLEVQEDEDDFLAAFNKDAPVSRATNFSPPPPSMPVSGRSTPAVVPPAPSKVPVETFDDDDDPFGLNEVSHKTNGRPNPPAPAPLADDDDILGDLGKPVLEKRSQQRRQTLEEPMLDPAGGSDEPAESEVNGAPEDRALAELVDMGFPADTAKIALAQNGCDVQQAVGWLLQQAHEESRQKARKETPETTSSQRRQPPPADREAVPSWMRQEGRQTLRQDAASTANGEKDATQMAQEFGSKFLKSANSLWKAGQKQVAKTMADFQQEGDASQPKWMRDTTAEPAQPSRPKRQAEPSAPPSRTVDVTDEAAMLDAPRERPQKPPRPAAPPQPAEPQLKARLPAEVLPQRPAPEPKPKFMQQAPPALVDKRPSTKLSRQEVEEQTAQAYISPARRKRAPPTPKHEPQPQPQQEPEIDLFNSAPPPKAQPAPASTIAPPKNPQTSRPSHTPPKPKAPPRNIPAVSASALATSSSHRKAGTEHFKRGDYAAAHEAYTSALNLLPSTHPISIVVLSNRALTALKTGDAKVAVSDADKALEIIGPSLGAGETIDLGGLEGTKDMKEFYGKALMRKAEALEHLEKYSDAAAVWRQAVGAGVGGAVSLKGRDRCEKASAPATSTRPPTTTGAVPAKPVRNTTPGPGKGQPPKSLGNSLTRPTITNAASAEAVKKLRAANAEAEKADDEKFVLADSVDAKLAAWRGGKVDNLRALLQSLDAVLWPAAGWKKVGMSDLVVAGKVKVIYMKAIAKVHPDKIPQDATTEQRMISAAVFATLNEAWDKFKKDNNL